MCSPVRWLVSFGCFVSIETIQGLIKCSVLCQKKHMGVSLGGLKMMCFFSLRFSWQKSAKSLYSEFWKVRTHWNTAKLVKAPESGACSGFVSSSQTSLNLPPSPWNCRKDPFANGYCIRISYGSNTCPNRCLLRSFSLGPRNCPHKNHSRVLLIRSYHKYQDRYE